MNYKKLFKWAFATSAAGGAGLGAGALIALARSKPNTKEYIRSVGWHRVDLWAHGLFYLTKTFDYIRLARFGMPYFNFIPQFIRDWLGYSYHGKFVPLSEAEKLISVKEDIEALNLERIIPISTCRDIILHHGDALAIVKCFCRHTSPNHCYPDDGCIGIGEPLVSYMVDHQPDMVRRATVDEAIELLEEHDKKGSIHAAVFKDVIGGRFYVICNCCKCCCAMLEGYKYKNIPFFTHSGLMPAYDAGKCTSCGKCEEACPFECLTVRKKSIPEVDLEKCMGCCVCSAVCPSEAVTMVRAPGTPEPLVYDELPRTKKSA